MAQLSLYIDDVTLQKIETAARISHISVSKWVREHLKESLNKGWPDNFFNLFGAAANSDFQRPDQGSFSADVPRESL